MTTIAFRDGILAADTLAVAGWTRRGLFRKSSAFGLCAYAGTGAAENVQEFLNWGKADEPDGFKLSGKPDDFAGLIVRWDKEGNHSLLTIEGAMVPWRVDAEFYARGSGADLALGAMAQGAAALRAIRVAALYDLGTGGVIHTYRFAKETGRLLCEEHLPDAP